MESGTGDQKDFPKASAVRTPVDVILGMARDEIEAFTVQCMQANRITPGLMGYVLKEVLLDITQMQVSQMAEEFTRQQRIILGDGKEETDAEAED